MRKEYFYSHETLLAVEQELQRAMQSPETIRARLGEIAREIYFREGGLDYEY